jgi:plasmid maintenance system antidote protein VapI
LFPALSLGHFFGTSPKFWINLQKLYELCAAEDKSKKTIEDLPTLTKRTRKQKNHLEDDARMQHAILIVLTLFK